MKKEDQKPAKELNNIKSNTDSSPKEDEKLVNVKKEEEKENKYKITEKPADEQMHED